MHRATFVILVVVVVVVVVLVVLVGFGRELITLTHAFYQQPIKILETIENTIPKTIFRGALDSFNGKPSGVLILEGGLCFYETSIKIIEKQKHKTPKNNILHSLLDSFNVLFVVVKVLLVFDKQSVFGWCCQVLLGFG